MTTPSVLDTKILNINNRYLYEVFRYGKNIPRVVGTASLQSQLYPADIDMLCVLDKKPDSFNAVQTEFQNIFNRMKAQHNLFFVEFKLQNKEKDDKYKFFNVSDIDSDFFEKHYNPDKIDICKIDLLQYSNYKFQDVSIIYFFNKERVDMNVYYDSVLQDQKDYYDEGKYYKSLKRLMVTFKLQQPLNINMIIGITNFFNSEVGRIYQLNNFITACLTYIEKFGYDERVRQFLKKFNLPILPKEDLEKLSKDYEKLYNKEAKKFYEHFNIPVGKKKVPFLRKRINQTIN
jgi:hypothetical protein